MQRAAASSSAAGGGTTASAAAALRGASRQQLVLALAACLGAGAAGWQVYISSSGPAGCEAPESVEGADGEAAPEPRRKTRIVVLGTGWGAVSFLKTLDPKTYGPEGRYEVTVVSPRSYFLYTPLLPSAAAGTVQERSIMEPVRNMLGEGGTYFQAEATAIDPQRRVLTCAVDRCAVCNTMERESGKCGGKGQPGCGARQDSFDLPYDVLVLGVGSVNNTFGIKGVSDHCFFLKSIDDAHRLRVRLSKVIEHAGLPHLSPEERRRHLNFVVVGGGPTGVELAAELHDFVQEDVGRLLPHLKSEVRITVVDTMDHLLGAFDRQLSEYTATHFARSGIDLQLGTMVKSVDEGALTVARSGGKEETVPFGTCVWATGVAMHPLVRGLKETLQRQLAEVQNSRTGVVVDGHLRVKGTQGTIFCLGDAAVTHQEKVVDVAPQLFSAADRDGNQRLSRDEVCRILKKSKKIYPQLSEMANLLEEGTLEKAAKGMWGSSSKPERYSKHIARLQRGLSFEEFRELLADMDTLMRSLPPTAQVAAQEGKYLAKLFSKHSIAPYPGPAPVSEGKNVDPGVWVPLPEGHPVFHYNHMGSFAYVGVDEAILDLPSTFPFKALKGWLVGLSWRSFETWGQVSARNRWMVQSDWIRTKLFGRNITEA